MDETTAKVSEGIINDKVLRKWTERVGIELRIPNLYNTYVNEDSIKHFVDGIGDVNKLWVDKDYAKKAKCGKIMAPPNFFYSVFPTWVLQGLPGVHAFHSGNDWKFYKPAFVGDRIFPKCVFTGFKVKPSAFAGKTVFEFQRAYFYRQNGELLAETDLWLIRAERMSARSKSKYSGKSGYKLPHKWTEEELEKITKRMFSEKPRGSVPRYWEDVNVGDELTLTKGPLGLNDMIAYTVGANPIGIKAMHSSVEEYMKHPAWYLREPGTCGLIPAYGVHFDKSIANAVGLPYPYDVGAQRHCWLLQLLTNWMGDDGWIKRNYAEYRRFFYLSDVLWITGKVVKKYVDEDREYCVNIETHAVNQRGEDTMPGYSIVALPSRKLSEARWPMPKRVKVPS